ncbi:hypothetical protein [Paraburkholderia sp.]|uniref:hypothetical protein n=1 Tax=Paraburkholderia sp. TaxID=1926495 RepID=UPI002F42201A
MTDSVASPQSRPRRAASKKQREGDVSTETENKLARAARSAQRLAQLSGVSGDDSTLDMFPDDPTRATLEAMNIDVRQGTLDGFELPEVVLQAVGALEDGASLDKGARRAPRAVKVDAPTPVHGQLSGFDVEPATLAGGHANARARVSEPAMEGAMNGASATEPKLEAAANDKPTAPARDQSAPLTSAMAAATVARSVTALREAAEANSDGAAAASGGKLPQRFAATFAKATTASRGAASVATAANAGVADKFTDSPSVQTRAASTTPAAAAAAAALASAELANAKQNNGSSAAASAFPDTHASFAAPREARRAEAAAALRAEPELDRARATAFADTVDALYGVIADQRRAASDHSRRMKWMLSIVVAALLVTVAIGVAQTYLLMRLTRETAAQQQRTDQMMQNQQAAMVSLLDTHTAMVAAAANPAPAPAATTPAAVAQTVPTPGHGRHAGRVPQGHKVKASGQH